MVCVTFRRVLTSVLELEVYSYLLLSLLYSAGMKFSFVKTAVSGEVNVFITGNTCWNSKLIIVTYFEWFNKKQRQSLAALSCFSLPDISVNHCVLDRLLNKTNF